MTEPEAAVFLPCLIEKVLVTEVQHLNHMKLLFGWSYCERIVASAKRTCNLKSRKHDCLENYWIWQKSLSLWQQHVPFVFVFVFVCSVYWVIVSCVQLARFFNRNSVAKKKIAFGKLP